MVNIGYYNGAVAVIADWTLSSLPIVIIWNMQISLKRKVGIAVLMGIRYLLASIPFRLWRQLMWVL